MSMSWLGHEFGDASILAEADSAIAPELEPVDYRILTLQFEGSKSVTILAALGIEHGELQARVSRPAFRELVGRVERAMVARITGSGEFEPLTAARAEAPAAMKRIIQQGRLERDPKVRLAANQHVLKMAGVEPARRVEVTTPDRILDQMTPEELALFAAHRKWPSRFREALRAYIPVASKVEVSNGADRALVPIDLSKVPRSTLPPVNKT